MLRLAERIATMKCEVSNLSSHDPDESKKHVDWQTEMIKRCPTLVFDNVASHYHRVAIDRDSGWHDNEYPNCAPLFESFFAEFNVPLSASGQVGFSVFSSRLDSDDSFFLHLMKPLIANGSVVSRRSDVGGNQMIGEFLRDYRNNAWAMVASPWTCSFANSPGLKQGVPVWLGIYIVAIVGFSGELVTKIVIHRDGGKADWMGWVWSCFGVLCLGLSFCHCKNVTQERTTYNAGKPAQGKGNKVPALKFYTLNIDPMKKTLRTEGQSETVGLAKALHICRGHFAHYSPEHPLFGKYVGTFWRPAHVRGSQENGVAVKDYKVKL